MEYTNKSALHAKGFQGSFIPTKTAKKTKQARCIIRSSPTRGDVKSDCSTHQTENEDLRSVWYGGRALTPSSKCCMACTSSIWGRSIYLVEDAMLLWRRRREKKVTIFNSVMIANNHRLDYIIWLLDWLLSISMPFPLYLSTAVFREWGGVIYLPTPSVLYCPSTNSLLTIFWLSECIAQHK